MPLTKYTTRALIAVPAAQRDAADDGTGRVGERIERASQRVGRAQPRGVDCLAVSDGVIVDVIGDIDEFLIGCGTRVGGLCCHRCLRSEVMVFRHVACSGLTIACRTQVRQAVTLMIVTPPANVVGWVSFPSKSLS